MAVHKNQRGRLLRIVEIQDITLEHKKRGVTQKWIFENVIYPRFMISKVTFDTYLATPAKRMLKEIEAAEKEKKETKQ